MSPARKLRRGIDRAMGGIEESKWVAFADPLVVVMMISKLLIRGWFWP